MDLRLYARVLWRFRLIVAIGFVLAMFLAILSMVRIGSGGVTYREKELFAATTRVKVTQQGAPDVRLFSVPDNVTTPEEQARALNIPVVDPNRFNTLAILYSEYATSDPVRELMLKDGPLAGHIIATPLVVGDNRIALPIIDLTGVANSPDTAIRLSKRGASALETYVRDQQRVNNVPDSDRVILQEIVRPKSATVSQARSKTMPVVILLAVLFATIGLAFLLENLRPRVRKLGEQAAEAEFQGTARRRTA